MDKYSMLTAELFEATRPALLYLPIERPVNLEFQLKTLVLYNPLYRTLPNAPIVLAINRDVLERKSFKINPLPNGEEVEGRLKNPIENGAIVAVHVANFNTLVSNEWSPLLRKIQSIPLIGHDENSKLLVSQWHLFKDKEHPPEEIEKITSKRKLVQPFFALPEIEQEQLLSHIHILTSWLEGWQMQEGSYKHFNRLFGLLQKVVVPRYTKSLTEIYRYAYLKDDLRLVKNKKRLLTSPNQFQSWTTSSELAETIGIRNHITSSSPTARYLTIFKAKTSDVDIIASVVDIQRFIESLSFYLNYVPGVNRDKLWENVSKLKNVLNDFKWQSEVIVRSPVSRKIPAEVDFVTDSSQLEDYADSDY